MDSEWLKQNWKIIVLIVAVILLFRFYSGSDWTLIVCKQKLNEAECLEDSYVIHGYDSAKECLLDGTSRFQKEGFECGKDCKEESRLRICQEICNSAGCGN